MKLLIYIVVGLIVLGVGITVMRMINSNKKPPLE